jgi:hypothetical protein
VSDALIDETPVEDTTVDDSAPESLDADVVEEAPESLPTDSEGAEALAAEPAVVDAAPVVEEPPTPFAFRAFQQDYPIQGTRFSEKDLTLKFEDPRALQRVKQMLSHGREWEARGRQELTSLRRENEQLRQQPVAEIEQAKTYLDEFGKLMAMAPEELWAFCQDAQRQWPLVQAKAERAYAERLKEQVSTAQQPPEPDVDVLIEEVQSTAAELVQDYLQNQPWATPQVAEKLTTYLQNTRTINQYVGRAIRDIPEFGIARGQYAADWNTARKLLDEMTEPYRDAHSRYAAQQTAASAKLQQTTKIAVQNAASLAQAKKPAAAKPPAAPPQKASRNFKDDLMADLDREWREMQRAG